MKRSSPDVTQIETCEGSIETARGSALKVAADRTLGVIAAASPAAEIPRKSRRDVCVVVGSLSRFRTVCRAAPASYEAKVRRARAITTPNKMKSLHSAATGFYG